ncbi:MAG: tyrosine-type recombinase/integrase [Armatimonadota bacterium]
MHQQELSNATIARHLHRLRSFWRYLEAYDYVEEDPLSQVSTPRQDQKLPKYLGANELDELLRASQESWSVFCAVRNHATIAMLIYTGMRRGELIAVRTGEVALKEGSVTFRGNGSKMRVVPLVEEAVEAVTDWLEFRPDDCDHDYLFTTTHGNRIYPSRMQRIWKSVLGANVDSESVTMQTIRHSFATLLLQSGECSLVEIQRILGHSRPNSTAIYLHVNEGELRGAVSAHPLAT